VEKCLEDGTRDRVGAAGVVVEGGVCIVVVDDDWAAAEFARKRDWFE